MAALSSLKEILEPAIKDNSMAPFERTSSRAATRRVARALTLLNRAGRQLDSPSQVAPDRFHRDRLRFLAVGLRGFSIPLSRVAAHLAKGGPR